MTITNMAEDRMGGGAVAVTIVEILKLSWIPFLDWLPNPTPAAKQYVIDQYIEHEGTVLYIERWVEEQQRWRNIDQRTGFENACMTGHAETEQGETWRVVESNGTTHLFVNNMPADRLPGCMFLNHHEGTLLVADETNVLQPL